MPSSEGPAFDSGAARCPRCGTASGAGAKFCAECGSRLGAAPSVDAAERAAPYVAAPAASTERRQITVVFCDLVGSTALAAEVDPEDLTEIIGAFQRAITGAMTEFGGHVARYMGDGALVHFGYPQAHEDDAERAVRAALRAADAVANVSLPGGRRIQAHFGIATGLVVVGDIAGVGHPLGLDVAGATPNLASRLQELAGPGEVVVSDATWRLVGGLFEWRDLGFVTLKGLAEPVHAWAALGDRAATGRFDARHRGTLSPLIGREREAGLLAGLWSDAQRGQGHAVVISGEAGIGKSRLVAELLHGLPAGAHAVLRFFCSSHRQDSPLHPSIEQLERAAGFARGDTAETKLAKLEAVLGDIPEVDFALIAELLLLSTGTRFPVLQFAPQRKRERLLQALVGLLERSAHAAPRLVVIEDAQWSDASSRELLALLAAQVALAPILMVVTARPEFEAPWTLRPDVTRIRLDPLSAAECALLIGRIAGASPLPAATVGDIVRRADGVPLFVEEMTRAVVEGAAPHPSSQDAGVPVSLQASLLARLDRLGDAREIAEIAAAIGREWSRELLADVAGWSAEALRRALERLVDAGLAVPRADSGGESAYAFRHMLLRDAAYNLMVRERRRSVHARIAAALELRFPERAAANPEIVAYHCTEGGLPEKAAQYWLAAGQHALRRSAMAEALAHLMRGLELVAGLPDGEPRRRCELDLTVALGKAQIATQGYALESTGATFARARELCERLGEPPQLLSVLHGLWTHALMRAELDSARAQALDLLRRGQSRADPLWQLMGCRFAGVTHHPLGVFSEARTYLTRGIELYDPGEIASYAMITVDDPKVVMQNYLSWSLMCMGRLDEARRRSAESLEGARRLGHAFTLAHALTGAAFVALTIDSPQAGLAQLDVAMPLIEEHGIVYYGAVGLLFRGWCLAAVGEAAEAETLLARGMTAYRATGSRLYLSGFLRMSAEAHERIGRAPIALQQIHEAFQVMYATSQRWDEAEMHRVHGSLLAAGGDRDGAAAATRRALAIASAQGAGLWELRAACALARLDAEAGERSRARDLLAPICARFDGEAGSTDSRAARELLEALG